MRDEVARFEAEIRALAWQLVHVVVSDELARRAPPPSPKPKPKPRAIAAVEAPVQQAVPPAQAPRGPGRIARWTREAIVEELVTWMISGTTVDAAFLTRHGPPGLVAAARRIFGRFEAALNVAAIQVAARYPDGPPRSQLARSRSREAPEPEPESAPEPDPELSAQPTAPA